MLHSGLLLLEANLNYPVGSSFNTITKDLIGNTWNIISGITVAFVLYILTYAYISANGAIISETISMNLGYHANPRIVGICTAIFVASVLWISSLAASRITSLFLGLKIISFVIVFGSFFFQVDYSILRDSTSTTAGTSYFPYIFMALPVCLASFGFHGNIPSLIICYGKRKDKLIKSVVFGSLLALVIYLFWLYCTMGNIPRESFKAIISSGGNVDSLVKSFLGTKQHGIIEFCLLVFSNLAVASSFFGVTLGLFDYLADLFKIDNSHGGRFKNRAVNLPATCFVVSDLPERLHLRDRRCRTVRHHLGGNNSCCTGNQSPQEVSQSDVHGLGRQSYSGDCHSLWHNRNFMLVR